MQMPLLSLKNDRLPLLFESEDPGEVWKLFCELQNILPKLCYSLRRIWTKPLYLGEHVFDILCNTVLID